MSEKDNCDSSDMPDGWERVTLSDLAEIDSNTLREDTPKNFSFYYLDISSASHGKLSIPSTQITFRNAPSRARKIAQQGDVLMSTVRPNLKAFAYLSHDGGPFVASTGFAVLTPRSSSNGYFILNSILSDDVSRQIEALVVGSNYPAINSSDVRQLKVNAPPTNEQKKIARILTTVDNLIEKTEALIEKYKAIKQGMMQDLFTRGVDQNGKLRPPYEESPHLYKESPLGWIPKEWAVYEVGDRYTKRSERGVSGLPVMSIAMRIGLVERDTLDRRVESNLTPEQHLLVREGDIAYNMMRMWQGVLGIALYDCLVSPAYVVMKPNSDVHSLFSNYLFSWEDSIRKFKQYSQGVVDDRLRLYYHDLVKIQFAMPSTISEQQLIAERLSKLDTTIQTTIRSSEKMSTLKAALMQDLLTGKVRVNVDEAEEELANA